MKTITKLFLAVALAALVVNVIAQSAGSYTEGELQGGWCVSPAQSTNIIIYGNSTFGLLTNTWNLPPASTNLLIQGVDEFDYVGLTFGFTGTATSTNSLQIYKSYDNGNVFEAVPSFQYLNLAPGTNSFFTNAVLDVRGVTTLAVALKNSGTSGATNVLLEINLKSPKFGALPATR